MKLLQAIVQFRIPVNCPHCKTSLEAKEVEIVRKFVTETAKPKTKKKVNKQVQAVLLEDDGVL